MKMINRSEIGHRIKDLMYVKAVNQRELGEKMGLSHTTIRNVAMGITKPRYEFIESLLSIYPEINKEWLLDGKGEMFLGDQNQPQNFGSEVKPPNDYLMEALRKIEESFNQALSEKDKIINDQRFIIDTMRSQLQSNFLDPNTGEPKMDIENELIAA